jgi:hypothetical protein
MDNDTKQRSDWPSPTPAELQDPRFQAIWDVIRRWDVNVPGVYAGYMGATGNHAAAILHSLQRKT